MRLFHPEAQKKGSECRESNEPPQKFRKSKLPRIKPRFISPRAAAKHTSNTSAH